MTIPSISTTGYSCQQEQGQGLQLMLETHGLRYIDSSPLEGQSLPKEKYNLQSSIFMSMQEDITGRSTD